MHNRPGRFDAPAHGCPLGTWAVDRDCSDGLDRFGPKPKTKFKTLFKTRESECSVILDRYVVDDKSSVVWPKSQAQREAVLPLPKGTTYSNQ